MSVRDGVLDCGDGVDVTKLLDAKYPRAVTVIEEITAERLRQITKEGWTREHDAEQHGSGELAAAAASYAVADVFPGYAEKMWPWDSIWWKPTTDRRNLIKAAALIIAEIERIDRSR